MRHSQNHLLAILILFFMIFRVEASNQNKTLTLNHTNQSVKIDGLIDPVWSEADSVSDFVQFRPYHGVEPSRKTVAKLLSSDEALYCLIISYDDRENIQRKRGKLDDFGGDVVSLMIDTFGDQRTAYKFAVSASGVRSDARLLDDARNRDYGWDGIWFSAAHVYDWGFVVEMRIPYKSIKFNPALPFWGLDFDRWNPVRNEDIYWCSYEESEGQRISKFGRLLFSTFRPEARGLNLEIFPVALSKATYVNDDHYSIKANAGIDMFYNPSPKLTFQLTANPDFAQIEADPFDFNITRYETYFEERRPFFSEGKEVFMPSGRQRDTGFYRPLELFYSRRIGKKLPDGSEVPLLLGARAFGRFDALEYGGFVAMTPQKSYLDEGIRQEEPQAFFGSARIKKQILGNSSIGLLYVGKATNDSSYHVFDVDGAFRTSQWQLAYQLAHSLKDGRGDLAAAAGFTMVKPDWITFLRGRYVGPQFDVDQIGFVPWRGNAQMVAITGPRWYFGEGVIRQIELYGGGVLNYEKVDAFTDYGGLLGMNMQFRNNWGYEINFDYGKSKELDVKYNSLEANLAAWFMTSPTWHNHFFIGYAKTYNFARDYLAFYSSMGGRVDWQASDIFNLGTTLNVFIEGNPDNQIEEITYNARPYVSITPVNDLNIRFYVDNVFLDSSEKLEQMIFGFLFSYNYSPKSWIYLAINEIRDRPAPDAFSPQQRSRPLQISDRVGVLKISYLYYF